MSGCIAHSQYGYISTSDLKSDVQIVFLDPNFLYDGKILAIRPQIRAVLHYFAAHVRNGRISTSGLNSDVTGVFLDPDFQWRKNFGDSLTFKADIGLLNICMGFQDLLA